MKQDKIELILNTCIDIFSDTGMVTFAKLLKEIRDTDGLPSTIEALQEEEKLWIDFESQKKRRMVQFGDESGYLAQRYHIVSVSSRWERGFPSIILNEMPEDLSLKDNPIKNVVLVYSDDRIRDRDYTRLRTILG